MGNKTKMQRIEEAAHLAYVQEAYAGYSDWDITCLIRDKLDEVQDMRRELVRRHDEKQELELAVPEHPQQSQMPLGTATSSPLAAMTEEEKQW